MKKYVSTASKNDIVTIPQIFERYYAIHDGDITGFEDYVNGGFLDDAGFPEYYLINEKAIAIEELFPDWVNLKPARGSSYTTKIEYGRNGEYLELSLFHSEDTDDNEYHFNIFECKANGDVNETHSVNATRLRDVIPFE